MKRTDRYGDYIFFRERLIIEKRKLIEELEDIENKIRETEEKIHELTTSTRKTARH